ncbi:MAG: protein kinase [Thermoanaerobaculales bacterium]|nr:protein kinase [Thermoanaerobaculales bacterium]
MIGTTLGHYRIVEKIGEGGMGEVYRAHDERLDRDVAVKVLPAEVSNDPDRLARFEREAKAVAALNHPNIVTLHTIEEADGHRFITMELVTGHALAELIPNDGMALTRVLEIAIPFAGALAAAHEKGVVHRDLKPGNVMVDDEGRVKILDFGLAKLRPEPSSTDDSELLTETLTREGHVMGTLPYMPPEQVRGERVDARADLYSFGVMLYEMASGDRPFSGDTSADLASAILTDTPRPLEELRPDLPWRMDSIVERCLHKEPKRRTQSALDLQHELEDFRQEIGSQSRQPASAEKQDEAEVHFSQSRRRLLAGISFAGLALVVTLLIFIFQELGAPPSTDTPSIHSLAVLPFDNLMNDPEQDYFVDGMHEALLTDLAKMESVRVISRSSVMRYKEAPEPIREIARELDVDAVIEGSVLRSGNRVRITAQLIDGATDDHLWADSYDRDLEDVLGLLSEVSRAISGEIHVAIASGSETADVGSHTVDPEAYEAYLRGRHAFDMWNRESRTQACKMYQRAIELDPDFAPAWSALAMAGFAEVFGGLDPARDEVREARAAARRALELDPNIGEAHAVLGFFSLYSDWDWPLAARELKHALALSPHSSGVRHAYADYLLVTGKLEESLEQTRLGRTYDPLSPLSHQVVLYHALMAGHYEEVIVEGRQTLEKFPDFTSPHGAIGDALWVLGRYKEAVAEYEVNWGPESDSFRTFSEAFDRLGPQGASGVLANHLAERAKSEPIRPHIIAEWYALAGENDSAFEWLEKAYEVRSAFLLHTPSSPNFASLHSDPRFDALMQRIGIPRVSE